MGNPHGSYIWYELMTPDAEAATRFYGDVIGWDIAVHPGSAGGGADYRILSYQGDGVGGMFQLTSDMCDQGARPAWVGYFGVDDVDASVGAIEAAGGKTLMPATDLPGVGRIAMAADPQGLPFYVMRPSPPPGQKGGESGAFDGMAVGHVAWNELVTSDLEAALSFYEAQFNVTKGDTMPMGEMGDYQFIDHGGRTIGGAMKAFSPEQPLGWTYYIRVADIDVAKEKVGAGGGKVMMGPHQVPGDDWVIIALDPQGARFGLVGARKAS